SISLSKGKIGRISFHAEDRRGSPGDSVRLLERDGGEERGEEISSMSLISDLIDGVLEGTGWATGVAVVLGVAAVGARRGRPLVKEVMKGYVLVSDRVKELMAETGEQLADLYAEARAEYETGAPTLVTMSAAGAAPEAAA